VTALDEMQEDDKQFPSVRFVTVWHLRQPSHGINRHLKPAFFDIRSTPYTATLRSDALFAALSQVIRRLETALGKNLFRRNSYGVTLTDFDEIFPDIAPTFGSRGDPCSRFSPNRVRLHRRIPFGL